MRWFFYRKSLERSISNRMGVWLNFKFYYYCFDEIAVLKANSADPNQTLQKVLDDDFV